MNKLNNKVTILKMIKRSGLSNSERNNKLEYNNKDD